MLIGDKTFEFVHCGCVCILVVFVGDKAIEFVHCVCLCVLDVLIGDATFEFAHCVCCWYGFSLTGIKTVTLVVSNPGIERRGGIKRLKAVEMLGE